MLRFTTSKIKSHHGSFRRLFSSKERREAAVDIPESADVVIIGGGSAGCHTLYQLAKRGVYAVLLERAKVTSGTTWHTAGCLWRLRPNDVDTQLLNDTRDVLMQLEADTGLHSGWISNGGIFIADRKERLNEYERLATAGLSFNVESCIKTPKETKELFPLIDEKAIIGSLYSPGDGVIDPAMLCAALTKGASKRGAKVIENCRVTNIITKENLMGSKEVKEVVTPHGNIKTKCIVNCAGVWAQDLAAMVGMQIPLVPMKHSYIVTESIPGVRGLPNIRDHDSSTYFRMQGESICMGGYENNPIILDKVPPDFEFSLYELDWSAFNANMQGAIKLVPAFEKVGIKTTVCGPESFTPDHKALLGEDPCVRGFYYHCGHNSSGMMLGGGCGIQTAQWIVNGRPDLHMFNYDIRRFLPVQRKNREWSIARSHESYARNYYIVFPHDERLAGRNLIHGPIHQEHVEAGCVFQECQGFERPGWFSKAGAAAVQKYDWYGAYGTLRNDKDRYRDLLELDYTFDFTGNHDVIGEECLACREHVALFDMSAAGKFYLSGAQAEEAANWLFTSDIKGTEGRTAYTCTLNSKAGVEADLTVSSIQPGTGGLVDPVFKGNGFYIVTGGGSSYHCWAHMRAALFKKNFKANFVDVSNKIGILSLQGPKSHTLLQSLTDEDVRVGEFQYCTNKLIKVAGHLCRAIRISFVGELGWELHVPWDSCLPVYRAIIAEGAKHGLHRAGYRALDSLSCEKGYVLWHSDLQSCDNPLEAGLGYLCHKNGSFLGKEALDEVRQKGPLKKLAFFQLQEKIPVWGQETVLRDGQVVGYLRRGEYGYALGASIGKGYIKHPEGSQLTSEFILNGHYQLEIMGKRYDTAVHLKSPFDPTGKRLRGVYDEILPVQICMKESLCKMLRWAARTINVKSSNRLLKANRCTTATEDVKTEDRPIVVAQSPVKESSPQAPESADVVIIGGGCAGCHTLYQLAKRGMKAVLLERVKVTSGTTWHSSGIIWRLRPRDVETQLLNSTRDLLMQLEAETGLDPGWINNGGLFVASTKERMDEYRRMSTMGMAFGIETTILGPEETKKVFPLIDADVIQGSLYSPGDGVVDPTMLCKALTEFATRGGAQVIEKCPVISILKGTNEFGSQKITGVVTPYGTIKTDCVVNCSGVWSREIAAMVGLHLPLVPMKHAYVVTESIPEVRGLPNIRDHDASLYFRVQGESLCLGGYEVNPIVLEKVPNDFEFSLYELDWIVFSTHMRGAVNLIPAFETAGIKTTVCGPECFTPDHKPLLGEDPRLHGFFHNVGYNASGMMLGGGCAEQLAHWIVHGRPELHMFNYDIRRFTPAQRKDAAWVFAKSHESYATHYHIVFPHYEPLAGRNFYTSPFHKELVDAGCVFEQRQGWETPGWFSPKGPVPVPNYDWYGSYGTPRNSDVRYENILKGDHTFGFTKYHNLVAEECMACREQVVMCDMSYSGKLYLCGPDAQRAADWLFTSDTRQPTGGTVYSCLLNSRAGVEADVTVSAIETGRGGVADPIFKGRGFYIVTGGLSSHHTWAVIQSMINSKEFKVGLTDFTEKMGVLSLQGPNSRELLQPLIDVDLSEEAFPYLTTQLVHVTGHLCRAIRNSSVGELGWELHIPWDSCLPIYKAIWEQGGKHGLRHAGYRALRSLNSEKGNHLWTADLRMDDNLLEAGMDSVCREEGDFCGKDALEVIRKKGLKKKRALFLLKEDIPIWGMEIIWRDGEIVGYLRRGHYGFALGKSIGIGYVKHPEGRRVTPEFLESGKYQIEVMGKKYDTDVFLKSPFDPTGKRLKGIYDEPLPVMR